MSGGRFAHLRIVDSDSDSEDVTSVKKHTAFRLAETAVVDKGAMSGFATAKTIAVADFPHPSSSLPAAAAAPVKGTTAKATAPAEELLTRQPHSVATSATNKPTNITETYPAAKHTEKKGPPRRLTGYSTAASTRGPVEGSEQAKSQQNVKRESADIPSVGPRYPQLPAAAADGGEADTCLVREPVSEYSVELTARREEYTRNKMEEKVEDKNSNRSLRKASDSSTVFARRETKEFKVAKNDKPRSSHIPATKAKTSREKNILSEKYWERTYGLDPSKLNMPLFVAEEHYPPKGGQMMSRFKEQNVNKVANTIEMPCSAEDCEDGREESALMHPKRDTKPLGEDLTSISHANQLPEEKSEVNAEPGLNMPSVIPLSGDHAGSPSGAPQPNQYKETQGETKRHSRKDSGKGEDKNMPNISDGAAFQEELSSNGGKPHSTNVAGDTIADERSRKSLFAEESKLSLPGAAHNTEGVSLNPKSLAMVTNDAELGERADHVMKEREDQRGSNRDNVRSSVGGDERKQGEEKAREGDAILARGNRRMPNRSNKGSRRGKESESRSPNGGTEQVGYKVSSRSEEPPRMSELTLANIRKLEGNNHEEKNKGEYDRALSRTDCSMFKSCISPGATDAESFSRRQRHSKYCSDSNYDQEIILNEVHPAIPPFHKRLILDMKEKALREKRNMEHSLNEYTFHPQTAGLAGGRLPNRRHLPRDRNATGSSRNTGAVSPSHVSARRAFVEESPPSFKPEISKYARETQQSNVPCHERLYAQRSVSPQKRSNGASNDHFLQLSPRMMGLLNNGTTLLFQPDISPRAKAIENHYPFHQRLYPSKEELERRHHSESPAQSQSVSPRRTSQQIKLSPRLLERPATPPATVPYSFHPDISPRAKAIENNHPFHQRLYPSKEELERRHHSESPAQSQSVSPRRTSQQIKLSPRLLERPAAPPQEILPYSFHPQISPRAKKMDAGGPVYERLYPAEDERIAVLQRQQKKFDELLYSFHPSITPRGSRVYQNSDTTRQNVVRRLTEPKEPPRRYIDPSLTFHPFITQKARNLKNRNSLSSLRLPEHPVE